MKISIISTSSILHLNCITLKIDISPDTNGFIVAFAVLFSKTNNNIVPYWYFTLG